MPSGTGPADPPAGSLVAGPDQPAGGPTAAPAAKKPAAKKPGTPGAKKPPPDKAKVVDPFAD